MGSPAEALLSTRVVQKLPQHSISTHQASHDMSIWALSRKALLTGVGSAHYCECFQKLIQAASHSNAHQPCVMDKSMLASILLLQLTETDVLQHEVPSLHAVCYHAFSRFNQGGYWD